MESTPIRELLQSLCTNSSWSYAVFWNLQQQNHMFLTFEDGYYEYPRLQEPCQSILVDDYSRQGNVTDSVFETNIPDGHFQRYPIHVAIGDMSCHLYELGEGLVGKAAAIGNDLWIYMDDIRSIEFMSKLKYPDEWLLATIAGIKTTLLAPVLPHGVLQLGSLEKVPENMSLVADIKERLIALQCMTFTLSIASDENPLLFPSTLIQELDNEESCEDTEEIHTAETAEDEFSNGDQLMLPFIIGNCFQPKDIPGIPPFKDDQYISYMYPDHDTESNALNQLLVADMWPFSHQPEGFYDSGVLNESANGICDYLFPEEMKVVTTAEKKDETGLGNVGNFGSFPTDYELHEALGPVFQIKTSYEQNMYSGQELDPIGMEPSEWFDKGEDKEHHFEALNSKFGESLDDTVSYNSCRSSLTSPVENAPPFLVHFSCNVNVAMTMEETSTSVNVAKSLASPSSFEIVVPKIGKCKGKSKSSRRQKPRDRQLLQDRLKELRELVPNGENSSIDGLLEQTIKHMMFLKNVTEQAEKVKQFTDKFTGDNRKNTSRNSCVTSKALEDEQNHESCPVMVKDLEHPGQIHIQMLCNNEAVFFEMAEVMHQLKLTILKGVMETCCSKWAHFIVQASIGFNRLDMFWPLMRILQRNGDWTMNQWCP